MEDAGPDGAVEDAAADAGEPDAEEPDAGEPDAAMDAAMGDAEAGMDADAGMPEAAARLVEVIATDFDFNSDRIYAKPGETLIVSLRNEGTVDHDMTLELPDGDVGIDGTVAPQETARIEFTVPEAPDEYTYFCPIGNHRELGMEGTLVVRQPPTAALELVAEDMVSPVAMAMPGDDSERIFVVDQVGLIHVVEDGSPVEQPFLDIRDQIVELNEGYDERGLLGLAFHPQYADNGRFFVYYSAPLREEAPDDWDHTSRLSEFMVSNTDANRADPESERVLLRVDQPQSNHNGGTLAFGPEDGLLYLGLGDGGGAGDIDMGHTPELGNGQDTSNLLGSILRIDVDGSQPYAIPEDNPFVDDEAAEDEIFAYGFRNPYRFSFDMGGDHALLVGDAGQVLWEEVSRVMAGGNYGWHILEGTHCFNPDDFDDPPATCDDVGPRGEALRWPVIELPNAAQEGGLATAVVGGYVYRGDALPDDFDGRYVFGVYSTGEDGAQSRLYAASDVDADGEDLWPLEHVSVEGAADGSMPYFLKGLGQDAASELYALVSEQSGPTGSSGQLWRLVPPQ